MSFPFFKPQTGNKRFAAQPQTIYSEFPKVRVRLRRLRRLGTTEKINLRPWVLQGRI